MPPSLYPRLTHRLPPESETNRHLDAAGRIIGLSAEDNIDDVLSQPEMSQSVASAFAEQITAANDVSQNMENICAIAESSGHDRT